MSVDEWRDGGRDMVGKTTSREYTPLKMCVCLCKRTEAKQGERLVQRVDPQTNINDERRRDGCIDGIDDGLACR